MKKLILSFKKKFTSFSKESYLLLILFFIALFPRLQAFKTYCYAPPGIGSDAGMMAFEISQQSLMRNAGYPGFALIAGLLDQVLPFSTDINLSLISLVSGLGCIFLIYLLAKLLFKNKIFAFISAFLLATTPVAIYINSSQEIYSTQAFFLLLSFYLLIKAILNKKTLLYAGMVYGFTIAVHQSSLFALPFLIIFFFWLNFFEKKHFYLKNNLLSLLTWAGGIIIPLFLVFGWMKLVTGLDWPKFVSQFFGEFAFKLPTPIQKLVGMVPVEISEDNSYTPSLSPIHPWNWYKVSWFDHLWPRFEISFGREFFWLYALAFVVLLFSKNLLGILFLILIISSAYLEFNPSPAGDNGRFFVMIGPSLVLTIGFFLNKTNELLTKRFGKKLSCPFLGLTILICLYLGFKGISSPWIHEKAMASLYRARKIYYTWVGKTVPAKSYFIEDDHMPQDGEYYSGLKVIFDDSGNLGLIEGENERLFNEKRWQLTKVIDRFPPEQFLPLLEEGVPVYSQKRSILARNLESISFSLNQERIINLYQDWSSPEAQKFIKLFNCTNDSESKISVNSDKNLVISLLGKNDEKYENAICDIKNLKIKPEQTSYFEIRYRMENTPGSNYSESYPARTSLSVNLYEKGKTDRDYLFNTELPYSQKWQTFRINLREEFKTDEVDGLRLQMSNFWDRYFDGQTNLIVDYIKFSTNEPWYKIVEVDREPLTNFPLYQVIVNDNFIKNFQLAHKIELLPENNYFYEDDFTDFNWLTDSFTNFDIQRIGQSLAPKRHLSPASITYNLVANQPLTSLNLSGKVSLGYYSKPSYFKVYVKKGNDPYRLAYQIYSKKRENEDIDVMVDLSRYLSGAKEVFIRFDLYSDGISKYRNRGGINAQLKSFELKAETQ
ncbi:MAG: glycosyltransferase family 39 protein [Patescibacteria group bacterium]|nr:glycosyltransferase family 39 protein [Patescibacteria group bacterium]